jgi:hypothetical protein
MTTTETGVYVTPGHPVKEGAAGFDCGCGECLYQRTPKGIAERARRALLSHPELADDERVTPLLDLLFAVDVPDDEDQAPAWACPHCDSTEGIEYRDRPIRRWNFADADEEKRTIWFHGHYDVSDDGEHDGLYCGNCEQPYPVPEGWSAELTDAGRAACEELGLEVKPRRP